MTKQEQQYLRQLEQAVLEAECVMADWECARRKGLNVASDSITSHLPIQTCICCKRTGYCTHNGRTHLLYGQRKPSRDN